MSVYLESLTIASRSALPLTFTTEHVDRIKTTLGEGEIHYPHSETDSKRWLIYNERFFLMLSEGEKGNFIRARVKDEYEESEENPTIKLAGVTRIMRDPLESNMVWFIREVEGNAKALGISPKFFKHLHGFSLTALVNELPDFSQAKAVEKKELVAA